MRGMGAEVILHPTLTDTLDREIELVHNDVRFSRQGITTGSDYFDYIPMADGCIGVVVGDGRDDQFVRLSGVPGGDHVPRRPPAAQVVEHADLFDQPVTIPLRVRFDRERARMIEELGFAGIGVGAAMVGLRPVIEMMTMNFALLSCATTEVPR